MILSHEVEELFPTRDLAMERANRLDRKQFPPIVRLNMPFDTERLHQEYCSLSQQVGRNQSIFEDSVVKDALKLRFRISANAEHYWPVILSRHSDIAVDVQSRIDARRGISWIEHQHQLSHSRRIRSVETINTDYDPLVDERLCTSFIPEIKGTYIEQLLSKFSARVTRTRFARLRPGDIVSEHIDNSPNFVIRAHFVIRTNSKCLNGYRSNQIESETHFEKGGVYLVNNGIPHWAYNRGDEDRVHLLVSLDGQEDFDCQNGDKS